MQGNLLRGLALRKTVQEKKDFLMAEMFANQGMAEMCQKGNYHPSVSEYYQKAAMFCQQELEKLNRIKEE